MYSRNEFLHSLRRENATLAPYINKQPTNERHAEWIASLKASYEKNERILVLARWNPQLNETQLIAKAG